MNSFTRTMNSLPVAVALVTLPAAVCYFTAQHAGEWLWPDRAAEAPASGPTRAEALIAEHDCWTGEAPADVEVPGHVVVTVGERTVYGGERLTGMALEQVFDGADHGMRVHAFCR